MKTIELLSRLLDLKVRLWVESGQLRYRAPEGVMTPDLRTQLAERKSEIISLLSASRGTILDLSPIQPVARDGQLPLSFAQQRIWFLTQLEPAGTTYIMPSVVSLVGNLNAIALNQSLDEIIRRHEVLRTTFGTVDGQLIQIIAPTLQLNLLTIDLGGLAPEVREAEAQRLASEEAQRPFDLAHGPLVRATLLRLATEKHVLLLTMHHIVSDGWSLGVFIQELAALYRSFSTQKPSPLTALPVQYADYAMWQREQLAGEQLEKHLAYWKQQLNGAPPVLELPTDRPRLSSQTFRGARHFVALPNSLIESLNAFCRSHDITPFMAMLAALKIALFKWTRQADIVLGTVVANRDQVEIEKLIGCFINFLPLRSRLADELVGRQLVEQVRATVLEAYAHQLCPFNEIVKVATSARRSNQNPIYNVAFLLQNLGLADGLRLDNGLTVKFEGAADLQSALLDLRFVAARRGSSGSLSLVCEYNTDLFKADTIVQLVDSYRGILERLIHQPETPLGQFTLTEALEAQAQAARARQEDQTIAIAATFTAEPLEETLAFWMQELDFSARIEFAPYNQVFQQLLDPSSHFFSQRPGLNVILLRLEDWLRGVDWNYDQATQNVRDLMRSLKTATGQSKRPFFVGLCPAAPALAADVTYRTFSQQMEEYAASEFAGMNGVYLATSRDLARTYPVSIYYDEQSEKLGHVPFTPLFFVAIGTLIARKIHVMQRARYKVIALDCDQTLWKGVCGEDGPQGIEIDAPHQTLQEFMVEQYQAGMLLCLCSKNNEEDVLAVFEHHPEMPVKREQLVAWRLNWQTKSENLKALAQELDLGLDSFIFLDDSALECAEVRANCPEVLTLQLPTDPARIVGFLQHVWAFDHLKITAEDRQRTSLYQQNVVREQFLQKSLTFADFLAGLELQIQFSKMAPHQIERVAQLTQRTNQFSCTTIRRSEAEVRELSRSVENECLVVEVRDRFGEYGLTGTIVFKSVAESLAVDTFLLSCRVLGRGVEYRVLAHLGEIAQERKLAWVEIPYRPTKKNQPALKFLEDVGGDFKQAQDKNLLFRFPAAVAAAVVYKGDGTGAASRDEQPPTPSVAIRDIPNPQYLYRIATELGEVEQILKTIQSQKRIRPESTLPFLPPRTLVEEKVASIWAEVLRLERVGALDNFFKLGGHSLLAVQILSRLHEEFQIEIPLPKLFEMPTVSELAGLIEQLQSAGPNVPGPALEPVTLENQPILDFEQLSDQEMTTLLNKLLPLGDKSQ